MILFVHNTWNRTKILYKNILNERTHFQNSRSIVLYNNDSLVIDPSICEHIYVGKNEGHKLACLNMAIMAIQLLKDSDCDTLVFSHDDVYLVDAEALRQNIVISNHHDIVCSNFNNLPNYMMLETFIVNKKAVNKISLEPHKELMLDYRNSPSPEMNFGHLINGLDKFIHHTMGGFITNKMGYHHHNYERGEGD